MKSFFTSTLLLFLSVSTGYAANNLHILDAYIPEAPPGAQVLAGYMKIHNPSKQAIQIKAVNSPDFNSVEMHLSREVNGIAKMLPQKSLVIAPNSTLELQPGSYHLMLIKPKQTMRAGDKALIKLSLSDNTSQELHVAVQKNIKKVRTMKCATGKCGGN